MSLDNADFEKANAILDNVSIRMYDKNYDVLVDRVKSGELALPELLETIVAAQAEDVPRHIVSTSTTEVQVITDESATGAAGETDKTFLMYLGKSICKFARNEPDLLKRIDEAADGIKDSSNSRAIRAAVGQTTVVGLANFLCTSIPALANVGVVTLSAMITLILVLGTDAFCSWLDDKWKPPE